MSQTPTRILLVEDNPADARLLLEILGENGSRPSGFELVEVARLAAAIQRLQDANFDLVLLDLSLPDSQGIATVVRVKDARPDVPIVVLTGYDDDNTATDALRRGAQDYLVKGQIDRRMLLRAIRYAIERERAEAQLRRQRERATVLREVGEAIASTLDLDTVLNLFLDKFASLFPNLSFTAHLVNPKTAILELFAVRNVAEIGWNSLPSAKRGVRAQAVMALGRPLVLVDLLSDPHLGNSDFLRRNGFVSYLGVPLIAKGKSIGVIGVYSKERRESEQDEVEFFSALGRQASMAIYNSRIHEQAINAHEREAVLRESISAVAGTLDIHAVLSVLLAKIRSHRPYLVPSVRLLDRTITNLMGLAPRDAHDREWKDVAAARGRGLTKVVADFRRPVIISDLRNDHRVGWPDFIRRCGFVSYLGVPLIAGDDLLGVLNFFTKETYVFADEEVEFLSILAGQAAMAIHNSQLYARLKNSNEVLEKTLEAKSMLTGVMAHELKTPIQVILGNAALLADNLFGEMTREQHERVRMIEAAGEEQLKLIDSTLEMARLEHGRSALAVTEVCVGVLIAELKVEFEAAIGAKGLELEIDAPPPGIIAMKTDRIKLKEILRNLIDNARKFTPQGKVTVRAAKISEERVEFVVSDTGVGIREDLLPKIFELFYQVSYLDKEKASAGLGLSIVKRLVEALSGEIEVLSEVGKGTTFRVSLPREIASDQPDEVPPPSR